MDIRTLQQFLHSKGERIEVDGLLGVKTLRAAEEYLSSVNVQTTSWTSTRMMIALEQAFYADRKIEVGAIDGMIGEATRQARRVYLDRGEAIWRDQKELYSVESNAAAIWPRQRDCTEFFGYPGTNLVPLRLPFSFRIAWDPDKTINSVQVNRKVKAPLENIWTETLKHYGISEIVRLRLNMFGGCFNIRKMRGGSALSMHSYGIAWDIDPEQNQLKWNRSRARLDDPAYVKFWEFVEGEGGVSLGRARDFDWMHFQFARLG